MGGYLSQPITEKATENGENSRIKYGVAAMQGWRTEMEDAHLCEMDVNTEQSMFGVFDGHGGKEVALFVSLHLANVYRATTGFELNDIQLALKQSFLSIDERIALPDSKEELWKLSISEHSAIEEPLKGMEDSEEMIKNERVAPSSYESTEEKKEKEKDIGSFPVEMVTAVLDSDSEEQESNVLNLHSSTKCQTERRSVINRILSFIFPFNCLQPRRSTACQKNEKYLANGQTAQSLLQRADSLPVTPAQYKDLDGSNDFINSVQKQPTPESAAGCTSVVAIITHEMVHVANAGDSRCVLCRDGTAQPMSRDHKPTDPDEHARIKNAGGFVLEGRVQGSLNLSRALGDIEYKEPRNFPPEQQMITADPEIKSIRLQQGDHFLILACDGIWDILLPQEACDFVSHRLKLEMELSMICSELCDFCLAEDSNGTGEGCDNMTAMIVLLKEYSSL